MAGEFNPKVQEVQPERVFKPYPAEISQPTPRKDYEEAFAGIGQTLHQGVKDAVQLEDLQITKEAHAKVDPLQEKSISDLDTMLTTVKGTAAAARAGTVTPEEETPDLKGVGMGSGVGTQPQQFPSLMDPASKTATLPIAVKNSERDLSLLEAARAKGTISETAKNMQEWSMLKDLRARYPGFREEVDAAMHKATGHDIANHTIQGLITDINSYITNKDAQKNKIISYLTREDNSGIFGISEAVKRAEAGHPSMNTMAQAVAFTARDKATEHQAKVWRAMHEKQEAAHAMDERDITDHMNVEGPQKVRSIIEKTEFMAGHTFQDLANGTVPMKNPSEVGMALLSFEDKIRQHLRADYMKQTVPQTKEDIAAGVPPTSLYSKLGPDKAEKLFDNWLKPIRDRVGLITDDKLGAMGAIKRNNEAVQDNALSSIYSHSVIGRMAAMSHAAAKVSPFMEDMFKAGETAAGLPTKVNAYISGVEQGATIQPGLNGSEANGTLPAVKPTGKPFTMLDAFEDARKNGLTSKVYDRIIKFSGQLTNPKANEDEKKNIAEYAFNPENMKMFPQIQGFDKQMDYYGYMTSDAMAREAKKLGGKYWEDYRKLTLGAYDIMFRDHAIELDNHAQNDPRVHFSYDNTTHQWDLHPVEPTGRGAAVRPVILDMVEETKNNFNRGLRSVVRVLKAEGMDDKAVDAYLVDNMKRMGVDFDAHTPSGKLARSIELTRAQEELKAKMKPGQF